MPVTEKTGKVRLFTEADSGTKHHGWLPVNGSLDQGIANPIGWAALHIVVQKLTNDEEIRDLYDQILIVENPGAVVVCNQNDRIGMVQSFRFTAERLRTAEPGYLKQLIAENRFAELLESLGRWQWELPKGLSPNEDSTDLNELVLKVARLEAEQEAGFEIDNPRIIGRVNPNPTFFAHAQYVVAADIKAQGDNDPEALEMIGQVKLFTAKEVRQLVSEGQFEDGLSLAALALAGYSF